MVIMGGRNEKSNPRARCVELNEFISCIICEGYLIDATTVIECLHSFCKTCIVKHLKTDNSCPRCKTQVHKTKPLRGLRSDPTLQDIVYKVVPGLYKDEMVRRKSLYKDNPDAAKNITSGEEKGEYSGERTIYSSEDIIPISLQYVPREINYSYQPMKDQSGAETKTEVANTLGEHGQVRFFRCVSAVTVRILKKLLRNKFDLKYHHEVQLFYKHDPLFDEYSILDLAYIYSWKRNVPLSLYYKISDLRSRTVTPKAKTNVPAKRKSAQSASAAVPAKTPLIPAAPVSAQTPSLAPKIPVTMPISISTSPPPARRHEQPESAKLGGLEAVRREAASILKEAEESQRKQQQQQLQMPLRQAAVVQTSAATQHENPLAQDLNKITQLVANIRPGSTNAKSSTAAGGDGSGVLGKRRKIVREPKGRKLKGHQAGGISAAAVGRGRPATVRDLIIAQPALRKIAPTPDPYLFPNPAGMAAIIARKAGRQQQPATPQSASHLLTLTNPAVPPAAAVAANILSNGELTITCTNGSASSTLPASCATVTNPVVIAPPPAHIPITSISSTPLSSDSPTKVIKSDSNNSFRDRQSPPVTINHPATTCSQPIDSTHLTPAAPGSALALAQALVMGVPASTTVSVIPSAPLSASTPNSASSSLSKPMNGQSDGTKIGSVIEKLAAKVISMEPPPASADTSVQLDNHKGDKEMTDSYRREQTIGEEVTRKSAPKAPPHLPLAPLAPHPAAVAAVQLLRKPGRIPTRMNNDEGSEKGSTRKSIYGKSKDDSGILFSGMESKKLDSPDSHLIPALNLSFTEFKVPHLLNPSPSNEFFSDENVRSQQHSPLLLQQQQTCQKMTSSPNQI